MTWKSEDAANFMLENGWQVLDPYTGTNKPWRSIHLPCGNEGNPRMMHIQLGRISCVPCGRTNTRKARLHKGEFAISTMMENGWKPLEQYVNNKHFWRSECMTCGRESSPQFGNVLAGRSHCGYCAGNKIVPEEAIAIMKNVGLEPQEEYPGAGVAWKNLCTKCGQLTYPRFADVKYGVRCSTCTEAGMNYSQPSHFYIMFNSDLQSIKVGISNDSSRRNRIETHKENGWQLYSKYDFESGKVASDLENAVLNWLRKVKNLPVHLNQELMPHGGFSETVDAQEISTLEIDEFTKSVIRDMND